MHGALIVGLLTLHLRRLRAVRLAAGAWRLGTATAKLRVRR